MQQDDIILINLLDVFSHPFAGLIQPLRLVHHSRFKIAALVVFLIQLEDVLVGEGLVVEADRVVVGLAFGDHLLQDIAFLGVNGQVGSVLLLGLEVFLELLQEDVAFLLQFLLLLGDLVGLDPLEVDEVELGVLLELDGELTVYLGDVDDLVGLLGGVEGVLDDPFLKGNHLLVDLLRKSAVELLHLYYEVKQLLLDLFDVLEPPEDAADLLDQVLALFGLEH